MMAKTNRSDAYDALIARALFEASRAHLHEFDGDPDVGREMRDALAVLYPDAERAFTAAEELRKALDMGFLPPPCGASPEAVRDFLVERAARGSGIVPALVRPAPRAWDDADFPF